MVFASGSDRLCFFLLKEVKQGYRTQEADHGGTQGQGQVTMRDTCHDVADRSTEGHEQAVRRLGCHVFDVVTTRTSRRENRRIRNRRAVVTENRARQRGRELHNPTLSA